MYSNSDKTEVWVEVIKELFEQILYRYQIELKTSIGVYLWFYYLIY